jgi:uncharacterized protein (TIGR02246 family)
MHYRSLVSSSCLIGAALVFCGSAHAADDASTICNAAFSAYSAAAASGDPVKMAAIFSPNGEVVSPWGYVAGHDALVKMYSGFMKAGDKEADTNTTARMVGDVAICTGSYAFTPASTTTDQKGTFTKVVAKIGGEWKIENLTYNIAAPQ